MSTGTYLTALGALLFTGAAGFGLYRAGVTEGMKTSASTAAATPAPTAGELKAGDIDPVSGKKVLYWHDPMVPGQKFDKPGKSPYMDMPLAPVYAEGGNADSDAVSISARLQQNLGVRIVEVKRGTLERAVEAVGSVAYNERDVAVVQARSNGYLEQLHVRAALDPVRRGQQLAELYLQDWVAAQEEYLAARRIHARAGDKRFDGLIDGARQRMRLVGMSEDQIRRVEASGTVKARMTLTAPIGGVVTELAAREGMTVTTGAPLFRINGVGTVWVNAEVPETLATYVRPGNAVEARASALPGAVFRGKVSAILPEVNAATRTMKARVEVANPGGRLVPGMFATVNLAPASSADVLLVPTEAVIQTGKRAVVILAQGQGRFAPVEVELGGESSGQTEIRKGLAAGQQVVASGQFLIDSEASLRGAVSRMSEGVAAAAPNASQTHRGVGRVEAIGGNEITLSHEAIPSLKWDAMTMDFALADARLAANIAVGQRVTFDLRANSAGDLEIVSLAPAPQPAAGTTGTGQRGPGAGNDGATVAKP